ncbi:YceI family protein [Tenacibaculum amylolyticum]|uniref:YceI family protein n=1 Tax=Tenacibaculum amylolyticum TaxID=104269 RepID=UPI003896679F
MKTILKQITGVFTIALLTFSFTTLKEVKKTINTTKSTLEWKGYKVTGSHNGTITIKSGFLTFDNDKLTGGSVTIDMASINTTDLSGDYKNNLDGHLKSDDFFGVKKFPTATLVFKKVKTSGKNAYDVKADLTIKGITKPVKFKISVYGKKATASLKVDRTQFNVRYGSASFFDNLKDKAIYDEFDLVADLELN